MQKKSLSQILIFFSLFILLVLPTAIVGFNNFSTLVNKAFGKPFIKEDNTFIVTTQSSDKISKGSQFSLKVSTLAPKTIPMKYFVAFVEFDKSFVDVKGVQSQNPTQFKVASFQNGYLIYPSAMAVPTNIDDALPEKCYNAKSCSFTDNSYTTITFSINAILLQELTEQQRPFKITIIGASETSSTYIWNQKIDLPALKLGAFVKNSSPTFTSDPTNYIKSGNAFTYTVTTKDEDNDPVMLSLDCPEKVFCTKVQKAPNGLTIEDNIITWKDPVYRKDPYEITVYANDGKSVTTQTFNLYVLEKGTSYFSCTFTPAIAVKILDYSVVTPLVIVANSTENLTTAKVSLMRNGSTEKTFNYTFTPGKKFLILDQNSTPALKYQFNKGTYTGKAEFTSEAGETFTCELENPTVSLGSLVKQAAKQTASQIIRTVYASTGLTVAQNNTPSFTTDPMLPAASGGSSPSTSFVYGRAYSFTLRAQDVDGDPLQHMIVAKPSWAAAAISSTTPTTGPSTYTVQFTGTPQLKDAGSNLFAVSINDGYGHFITRVWVINIDYPDNDIPRVSLTAPSNFTLPSYCPSKTQTPITLKQGQSFMMVFDAEDRNQIVKFNLYYTKSLSSSATKTLYIPNISYKMRCMSVGTSKIPPGDYYFMLTATDNFNPPATGAAYTGLVRILPKPTPTPKPTTTPTVTATASPTPTGSTTGTATPTPTPTETTEPTPQENEPLIQITSPKQNDKIKPQDFQLVASLSASKDAELVKANVVIKLDDTEITDKVLFSADKGKAITVSYKPSTLLDLAIHTIKIQILDSKKKSAEQQITFTIANDDNTNQGYYLFGMNFSKDAYTLIIVAFILIAIIVLLPIIMYFAFRNSEKDNSLPKRTTLPQQPQGPLPQLRTPTSPFSGASTYQPSNPLPPVHTPSVQPQPTTLPTVKPLAAATTYATTMPQSTYPTPIKPPVQPVSVVTPQQTTQVSPKQALDAFVSQAPTTTQVKTQTPAPMPVARAVSQPPQAQPQIQQPVMPKPVPQITAAQPVQQTVTTKPPAVSGPQPVPMSTTKPQNQPLPPKPAVIPQPTTVKPINAPPTVPGKTVAAPTTPIMSKPVPQTPTVKPSVTPEKPSTTEPTSSEPLPPITKDLTNTTSTKEPTTPPVTATPISSQTKSPLPPESPSLPVK